MKGQSDEAEIEYRAHHHRPQRIPLQMEPVDKEEDRVQDQTAQEQYRGATAKRAARPNILSYRRLIGVLIK